MTKEQKIMTDYWTVFKKKDYPKPEEKSGFINIDDCPKNPPAKFYYPDGTLIAETDSDMMFAYIRKRIKDEAAKGCYIEFGDDRISIDHKGNLSDYPEGFFDKYIKLLLELV